MNVPKRRQGYILLHDPGSDSWLACRFDYQVTDDPRWRRLNPELKIHEEQGTRFGDKFVSMTGPDLATGTTLTFYDAGGSKHALFAHAPGEGRTLCIQTLDGPLTALSMLLRGDV